MECQATYEKLKRLFTAEPVLKHPDPMKSFVIQADANDVALGAVLLRKNESRQLHSAFKPPKSFLTLNNVGQCGRKRLTQ